MYFVNGYRRLKENQKANYSGHMEHHYIVISSREIFTHNGHDIVH